MALISKFVLIVDGTLCVKFPHLVYHHSVCVCLYSGVWGFCSGGQQMYACCGWVIIMYGISRFALLSCFSVGLWWWVGSCMYAVHDDSIVGQLVDIIQIGVWVSMLIHVHVREWLVD